MPPALFAGAHVSNLAGARAWYEQLLGEPAFFPNDREVVFTLADDRHIYIEEDAGRAGGAAILVFVEDLERTLAAIALEPAATEAYGNGITKVIFRDPDGNEISFAGGGGQT